MTKRSALIVTALLSLAVLLLLLLKPCQANTTLDSEAPTQSADLNAKSKPSSPQSSPGTVKQPVGGLKPEQTPSAEKTPPVDDTPPVTLSASDQIPDIAQCVTTKFPTEAKPHVKEATVTVRLVVDKFGYVRSVKTTAVEFGDEPAEDLLPMLRKTFIQAGNKAFGAKKCPPHVVNGQNVGYAIEVPLKYKH